MPSRLGKPTDGPVSRYINRRLSMPISRFIVEHNIPLTPNQASFIAFLVGALSLPLLALGHALLGGLLIQASSVLDGVDGEIARLRGMASKWGGFLDAVLDRVADTLIILGAALYAVLHQAVPAPYAVAAAVLAIAGSITVSYLHFRAEKDLGVHPALIGRLPSIASRDVRLFALFIGCALGLAYEALWLVALLSYVYVSVKLLELSREAKK